MKTCPHCDSKGHDGEVVIRKACRGCGLNGDVALDELAQHLRDTGEYAVIRMDDPAVAALRYAIREYRSNVADIHAMDVCREAGILK